MHNIPDEAVQAMPVAIRDLLKKVYLLGFSASSEGYNSEYPFNEDEAEILADNDWIKRRDSLLSKLELPFLTGVKVDAQGIYDYVQSYEWRGDNGDYTPNDADREMLEDAIVGYLSAIEAAPSPRAQALEEAAKDAVESLFKDLRDRRFLKWVFDERGDKCLIGVFRDGSEMRGIDLEAQQEIRRAWQQIIERILFSTCGSARPAAPVEGLRTVGVTYLGMFFPLSKKAKWPKTGNELVTRSQAEAIIEMQADSIDKLQRKVHHWQDKHDTLEADNAALTARVKELEEVYERLEQQAIKDRKVRNEAQSDADLWRFSVDMGDHPSLLVKVWKQRKALETQLAAARKALENIADDKSTPFRISVHAHAALEAKP